MTLVMVRSSKCSLAARTLPERPHLPGVTGTKTRPPQPASDCPSEGTPRRRDPGLFGRSGTVRSDSEEHSNAEVPARTDWNVSKLAVPRAERERSAEIGRGVALELKSHLRRQHETVVVQVEEREQRGADFVSVPRICDSDKEVVPPNAGLAQDRGRLEQIELGQRVSLENGRESAGRRKASTELGLTQEPLPLRGRQTFVIVVILADGVHAVGKSVVETQMSKTISCITNQSFKPKIWSQ